MTTVISVENLSKVYRLGQIGTGTLANDLNIWWARTRGKPNPLLKFGRNENGEQEGGNVWALKDVSFTVEQSEVLGIIGRNGAGKSTLLKILSRITAPTSGVVKVKGRIASLLEVGTGFHPELTGRENIYLNGAILGMSRAEIARKFDEIVDFSGVEKFIDTPVKRYSSGMYVRLAFAVAAHLEPEILLVDEVLAVGDAEFQKKCLGKMGEVAKEGRTVLFVSHNMAAVSSLCKKGIVFDAGLLKFDGGAEEAIHSFQITQDNIQIGALKIRKDRRGNGSFNFTRLDIDAPSGRILSGKPLRIEIEVTSLNGLIKQPDLAVIFRDVYGSVIFTCFTGHQGTVFNIAASRLNVECEIPLLPLIPGKYRIDLWGSMLGQEADYICDAGYFVVDEVDYWGTGRMPALKKHGAFIVSHCWTLLETGGEN